MTYKKLLTNINLVAGLPTEKERILRGTFLDKGKEGFLRGTLVPIAIDIQKTFSKKKNPKSVPGYYRKNTRS